MALHCEHCGKGKEKGNMVSHAKNRTARFFRPNLQILKAEVFGEVRHVKLCTRCIKRMKRDGKIGRFVLVKPHAQKVEKPKAELKKVQATKEIKVTDKKITSKKPAVVKKEEKAAPALDLASIVGKKN
jgi:large subunit ribosomal protein L28